jgi:hypothetical protein
MSPASLAVISKGGLVALTPVFPETRKYQDPDGGLEMTVWQGPFEVRVPIEASAKAAPGKQTLRGRFRFQVHYDGQFYRVATREFDIPVTVVKAK